MQLFLKDFRENNESKKLNFGHTFGHAIESYYLKKVPLFYTEMQCY